MTEYDERVAKQRDKIKMEKWAGQVRYIHASSGIIETAFNNGDIQYVENKPGGKTSWYREKTSNESLMEMFGRVLADVRMFK